MNYPDQTKCSKCGHSYEDELDRMQDNNRQKSKHLKITNGRTFESDWGIEHAWTVTVSCECGNKFSFEEST